MKSLHLRTAYHAVRRRTIDLRFDTVLVPLTTIFSVTVAHTKTTDTNATTTSNIDEMLLFSTFSEAFEIFIAHYLEVFLTPVVLFHFSITKTHHHSHWISVVTISIVLCTEFSYNYFLPALDPSNL